MPPLFRRLLVAASLLGLSSLAAGSDWWSGLAVRDLNGAPVPAAGRWIVVVFLSPECPVANASMPTLNALAAEFGPRGCSFVGAYADPTLELPALRRHAAGYHVAFAVADDRTH